MMYPTALLLGCVCLSLSLGCVWSVTTADNPGVRTIFTTKGLNYFNQVGLPFLESELTSLQISDLSGDADVIIGEIEYTISSIQLDSIQIPTSSVTTSAEKGLTLQASGISFELTADWSYELDSLIPIEDHGTVDMFGSDISLTISVLVGADNQGHFDLSTTDCSFHVDSVDIELHGGASWLYNLFDDVIASSVQNRLNKEVCDAVTKIINHVGSKTLESFPALYAALSVTSSLHTVITGFTACKLIIVDAVTATIDGISQINYALLQSPTFTSSYVQSDIKGEIQSVVDPEEYPFRPSQLSAVSSIDDDKMVSAWITDYVVNSAAAVYQKAGVMSYTITDDMIPKESFFHLNTQSLSLFIPKLQKMYPSMKLKVVAHVVKPPTVNVMPSGANLTLHGDVNVYVIDTATNSTPLAFIIGVIGDLVFSPYLTSENGKEYINGKALVLNAELSLTKSNVGNFDVSKIQKLFDSLTQSVLIPELNEYGKRGLILPVVDGVSLFDSSITLGEGWLLITSDFDYKPKFF